MDERPDPSAGTAAAGRRVAPSPAVATAFAGPAAELMSVPASLLRRLVRAHQRSMAIAGDLFLAQDVACLHAVGVEPAIDAAAASDADPETIDQAMAVVKAAQQADEVEFALSREWGRHCSEVFALLDHAEQMLARVSTTDVVTGEAPA